MKLTKAQQKALLNALPASEKVKLKKHVKDLHMKGTGLMDIVRSVGSFLSPIVQQVGPTVLKNFILPFISKQLGGSGLNPAGGSLNPAGGGLKLAGQGGKKLVKGSQEAKDHMAKLRALRKK